MRNHLSSTQYEVGPDTSVPLLSSGDHVKYRRKALPSAGIRERLIDIVWGLSDALRRGVALHEHDLFLEGKTG